MRNKIFIGILIVGIILIGGWWILKSSVKQVLDEKYCEQDSDCVFGWPEKCIMGCVNKYTPKRTPCPLIRPAFFSSYIWDNTVCECVNNECVENRTVFCEEACRDWIDSNCTDGIPKSAFLAMKCETKIDCECLKSIQEVTITTDKTEYERGEVVKAIIRNDLGQPIYLESCNPYYLELKKNGEWKALHFILCEDNWVGEMIKPGETKIIEFNTGNELEGIYRWRIIYFVDCVRDCVEGTVDEKKQGIRCIIKETSRYAGVEPTDTPIILGLHFCIEEEIIYSNEFTIKKKTSDEYKIYLKSRQFIPEPGISDTLKSSLTTTSPKQMHVLLQFHHLPGNDERSKLSNLNVTLCGYIHNNAYFVSIPAKYLTEISNLSFIRWIGDILPEDKISSYIREGKIGDWAINEDGTVNLIVKFFKDVPPEDAKNIIKKHKGTAKGEVGMLNDITVSISKDRITELAKEDDVQWIEQVPPPPTIEEESG